jgi:hypothetical protein
MPETPAQRALTAAAVALAVAAACIALFLPPLAEHTLSSVLRIVVTGAVLAVAVALHWVFLGIAASRMRRSVAGWVGLSTLLFPIGSAAALILLGWLGDEDAVVPQPAPHHG